MVETGRFRPPDDNFKLPNTRDYTKEHGESFKEVLDKLNANGVLTEVDFGAFPGASDTSLAITGLNDIAAGAIPEAWIVPQATTDHTLDEHIANPPRVYAGNVVAGTGFTIYAVNNDRGDFLTYGKWTVAYRW